MPQNRKYKRRTNNRRRLATRTVAIRDAAGYSPSISKLVMGHVQKHAKKLVQQSIKDFMQKKEDRPKGRPMLRKGKVNKHRHEKLKNSREDKNINKGKGHNTSRFGTIVTHPRSRVPKWKINRLKNYKYNVWQTVLISKSGRQANSNNILKSYRYPIPAPEALDSERVQSMIFSPYPSGFSGIHTTYMRTVRADGTDLEHVTGTPFDVIQNKADIQRHSLPNTTDATFGSALQYQHTLANGSIITPAATQTETAIANNFIYFDQIVKNVKIDLQFMASRAFTTCISVSVIRHIKPVAPYAWTTEDKQQLLNNLSNHGLEYENYKVEYHTEFKLPGLKKGKDPPIRNVKKDIKCNFMQTNSFPNNNTAEDMAESSLNQLGLGFRRKQAEVADGYVSGMFYVIIKYRKMQEPQQFIYTHTIEANDRHPESSIQLPVLTEGSYDIPAAGGNYTEGDGSPIGASTTREDRASFYVHGTLKYNWGYRSADTEQIPSVMDERDEGSNKKTMSLNIDPTLTGDETYGIYTQSPSHQTRANNPA